jgi:methylated-DNA-[protein]-cysteine S-methyltransferase
MESQKIYWTAFVGIFGEQFLLATQRGVCWIGMPRASLDDGLGFIKKHLIVESIVQEKNIFLKTAVDELQRYFNGQKIRFSFPLDMYGTLFQKSVWHKTIDIPFGIVCAYKDVAIALNHPNASRAVGTALGANPLPFVIPCHRVIGSDKALRGYAGGLTIKKQLLELERI